MNFTEEEIRSKKAWNDTVLQKRINKLVHSFLNLWVAIMEKKKIVKTQQ